MMEEEKPEASPKEKEGYNWVEIVAAIVLALATVSTAWCAYQSARWSGVMTINFSAANATRTEAVTAANYAFTELSYDAGVLLDYAQAYIEGDTTKLEVLKNRFIRE